jgi:HPt (histidine-containing phosphotransfer) domain-containing protein
MSDTPLLLDDAVLDDLVEHIGADAARSVIDLFIGECRELAGTIAAGDPEAARRAAHSLKSSAGQLGAAALAAAALDVEIAAETGSPSLPQLAAGLLACSRRTESVLARWLLAG